MNSDFDIHDTILYPLTYNDLVLMAQNINPASSKSLRGELTDLLIEKINVALELFDAHTEEVYKAAFPEEFSSESEDSAAITPGTLDELADQIYRLLLRHEMWIDVSIYVNGKCLSTSEKQSDGRFLTRYNGQPFVRNGVNPQEFISYAGPYLTMSFEGPFYDAINHTGGTVVREFDALLKAYGLYYELGNAWNLTLYRAEGL